MTSRLNAVLFFLGVLLTALVLYPKLRESFREQKFGLLLFTDEGKGACGKPQAEEPYGLTYVDGDRTVALRFIGFEHKMFLNNVKWRNAKGGVGELRVVTQEGIRDFAKHGWVPQCLDDLSR